MSWEYLFVSATERTVDVTGTEPKKVRQPVLVNGRQLNSWATGPDLYEYVNKLGVERWELVSYHISGTTTELVFKRPKI